MLKDPMMLNDPLKFLQLRAWRWLAAACLACSLLLPGIVCAQDPATQWAPRSGDAWIDRQLDDINHYAERYRGAFIDEVVRYHAAPRELANDLLGKRQWAPGDVYYACALAQVAGRPCRVVVEAWEQGHAEGWEAIARQLGVTDRADANARLKQQITDSYVRWGRPLARAGNAAAKPVTPVQEKPAKPGPKPAAKSRK